MSTNIYEIPPATLADRARLFYSSEPGIMTGLLTLSKIITLQSHTAAWIRKYLAYTNVDAAGESHANLGTQRVGPMPGHNTSV